MKPVSLYALLSAGAMLLAGIFLAMAFRETDRGLDAVLVSAVVAFVIQVGAFTLALRFAQRGQAIAGWGVGALISFGTLIVFGAPMPVCSRCIAIYGGLLAGVVLFAAIPWLRSHPLPAWGMAVALLPLAIDGITQAAGLRESTNELRMLTGLLAGSGFAIWSLGAVESSSRQRLKTLEFESLTREKA